MSSSGDASWPFALRSLDGQSGMDLASGWMERIQKNNYPPPTPVKTRGHARMPGFDILEFDLVAGGQSHHLSIPEMPGELLYDLDRWSRRSLEEAWRPLIAASGIIVVVDGTAPPSHATSTDMFKFLSMLKSLKGYDIHERCRERVALAVTKFDATALAPRMADPKFDVREMARTEFPMLSQYLRSNFQPSNVGWFAVSAVGRGFDRQAQRQSESGILPAGLSRKLAPVGLAAPFQWLLGGK
jgi:hypothetical protein